MTMRLDLRQSQNLVLTPQLQQAIRLLQMSTLELNEAVGREALENPFLELKEPPNSVDAQQRPIAKPDDDGWRQPAPQASADTKLGLRSTGRAAGQGDDTGGRSFTEQLTQPLSLSEHLVQQIALDQASGPVRDIACQLVAWLDQDGYLRESDTELAVTLGVEPGIVAAARQAIQACDPAGVGAQDLADCLRLQLERQDRCDPAMRQLLKNLAALARAEFSILQRRCQVDAEDLQDMIAEIKNLDPKPGSSFGQQYIDAAVPDVFVYPIGATTWRVELNDAIQPKVAVDHGFQDHLDMDAANKDTKTYVGERLQAANWLVKALDQRSRTILRVSKAIFNRQRQFLEDGPASLRPLVLRNIAEATGLHESTVSRATADKFVATPHGTFPLKYFFSAALQSAGGEGEHSAEAIRLKIKRLIEGECAKNVLSDDRIVDLLREDGIVIARRTVAKYRESLNILSSSKRRRALLLQAS